MPKLTRWLIIAMILVSTIRVSSAQAGSITVDSSSVKLQFPNKVIYSGQFSNAGNVKQIILEYGVEQHTCGTVSAEAFPKFTAGDRISVNWTWEMLKSGSEPPGAHIWYQWKLIFKDHTSFTTDRKEVIWLSDTVTWKSLSQGDLTLHWYAGSDEFAQMLLDSATEGLQRLKQDIGLKPESPIDIYIFDDYAALRSAILYQPGWIGGLAFPNYNITALGINNDLLDWGKGAVVHELTHVVVGNYIFGCLINVPAWLNEGIAVYSQGGLDASGKYLFDNAIKSNTLLSIRSLSGGFAEEPGKADVSYSESYSIVNYLLTTYGREPLLKLFQGLKNGQTIDNALQNAYGLGLDELEVRWRVSIGAAKGLYPTPTAKPRPTVIPTYAPVTGN